MFPNYLRGNAVRYSKEPLLHIKTFPATLLALSFLTVFLCIENAEGFLIQDGANEPVRLS
jgi:hypothetical protein